MNWLIHPIDSLKSWGVRKFVLGIVNKALAAHEESVAKSRNIVAKCIAKLKSLIIFLEGLMAKLADNVVTDEEAEAAIDDAKRLAAELTAK